MYSPPHSSTVRLASHLVMWGCQHCIFILSKDDLANFSHNDGNAVICHPPTKHHGSILCPRCQIRSVMASFIPWGSLVVRCFVMRGMIRCESSFLEASSCSWWRQPYPLAVALQAGDRTDQTEGDAVSRAGSSKFDDVASIVPSCTGTGQDHSCQIHSAEQPACTRGPLLQALQVVGGGSRVVVSTAAFHARVRGSVPGLGGFERNTNVSSPSTCES